MKTKTRPKMENSKQLKTKMKKFAD